MATTFVAGQKLTASALTGLAPLVKVKSADQTVNNTTTLVDDTHLVQAIEANTTYSFELFLAYTSGTTPDFKIAYTIPTSATTVLGYQVFDTALTFTFGAQLTAPTTGIGIGGNAGNAPARLFGTVTVLGTAGNFTVRFAQNTANVSNTTLLAGSYLIMQKLT